MVLGEGVNLRKSIIPNTMVPARSLIHPVWSAELKDADLRHGYRGHSRGHYPSTGRCDCERSQYEPYGREVSMVPSTAPAVRISSRIAEPLRRAQGGCKVVMHHNGLADCLLSTRPYRGSGVNGGAKREPEMLAELLSQQLASRNSMSPPSRSQASVPASTLPRQQAAEIAIQTV